MNLIGIVGLYLSLFLHPGTILQVMTGGCTTGCSPSGATFTYVGSGKTTGGSQCTSSPCRITYSPTAGNAIRILYWIDAASAPTIAGSDNGGTHPTYFSVVANSSSVSGAYFGEIDTCAATSGITSVGISSSVITDAGLVVAEYSYSGGTCSLDQQSSLGSGSSTSITAGSITTTIAATLVTGAIFQSTTTQAVTPTSPYLDRNDFGCGACANIFTVSALDRIVSVTGTYAASGTVSASTNWYGYTNDLK